MNRGASVGVIVLANVLGSDAIDTRDIALKSLDKLSNSAEVLAVSKPQ